MSECIPLNHRKLEWEAELRFLRAETKRIKVRIEELEEIIRVMWPEEVK